MDESFDNGVFGTILLPVQFNDAVRRHHDLSGERRLMLAVLEDAIRCYLRNSSRLHGERAKTVREARNWIEARGDRGVFSYQTICDLLDIDAGALRTALRRAIREDSLRFRLRHDRTGQCSPRPGKPRTVEIAA